MPHFHLASFIFLPKRFPSFNYESHPNSIDAMDLSHEERMRRLALMRPKPYASDPSRYRVNLDSKHQAPILPSQYTVFPTSSNKSRLNLISDM